MSDQAMTTTLFAMQSIFDAHCKVFAYELLYRDELHTQEVNIGLSDFCDQSATASVLTSVFANAHFQGIIGEHHIFVNFGREQLLAKIPLLLPKEQIVVEILENVEVDDDLILAISELHKAGYCIALDDFIYHEKWQPLIELSNLIKIEVQDKTQEQLESDLFALKDYRGHLLAEKVETRGQYEICKQLGFAYFQGYYFSKPDLIQGQKIGNNKIAVLNLISALNAKSQSLREIEKIIVDDPYLSYRILLIVNSVVYRGVNKITSIQESIMRLGFDKIKSWMMLLLLSKVNEPPMALIELTIARAKMCELLGASMGLDNAESCYMVGILSTLDALLAGEQSDLMERLSLADDIKLALMDGEGVMGNILNTVVHYQKGRFEQLASIELSEQSIGECYWRSVEYAQEVTQSIMANGDRR